jgi:hypothetical protein
MKAVVKVFGSVAVDACARGARPLPGARAGRPAPAEADGRDTVVQEAERAADDQAEHPPADLEQLLLVVAHDGAPEGADDGPGGRTGEHAPAGGVGVLPQHGQDHEGAEDEGRDVGGFLRPEGEGQTDAEGVEPPALTLQDVADEAGGREHRPGDGVAVLTQHAGEVGEAGREDQDGHGEEQTGVPQPAPP